MIAFPFWDENPKILMRNAGFDGSILCKSPISKGIRKKQKLCKCLLLATPLLFPAPKILLSVGHLPSVPNRSPNSRPPHDRLHDQPLYQTHDQPHDRPIADSMSNSITDTNAMTINGHDWPYDRSTDEDEDNELKIVMSGQFHNLAVLFFSKYFCCWNVENVGESNSYIDCVHHWCAPDLHRSGKSHFYCRELFLDAFC